VRAVDDVDVDAGASKEARHRRSGRSTTDDEHVRIHHPRALA
jgi:hypothetical protein